MTNNQYDTRKEQIEKGFMGELPKGLDRKTRAAIKRLLRDAAMVGAAEERYRVLQLAQHLPQPFLNALTATPVLAVLGYES